MRNDSFVFDPFIDEIYEAAVLPEKWRPSPSTDLHKWRMPRAPCCSRAGPVVPRWLSSKAIESTVVEWTRSRWFLDNPRGQRLVPLNEPRFLTDFDALTIEEIDASDYYTDLLRPRGLGWCVGTSIHAPIGRHAGFFRSRRPTTRALCRGLLRKSLISCGRIWPGRRCCRDGSGWTGQRRL